VKGFEHAYRLSGGRYVDEMKAWAKALNVSTSHAVLLNCTYELSGMCTVGAFNSSTLGMVHVRTLDWPLPAIGAATRLFRFHRGDHEFVAVGVVGHVGVLSGMVPGAYSVTINWAPPEGRPSFDFGPAFLLREVLETCATYNEAVAVLKATKLSAAVFFFVCGAKRGQACVIERTRDDAAVRKMKGATLVHANHHETAKFKHRNDEIERFDPEAEEMSMLTYSEVRAATLEAGLQGLGRQSSLADVAACLDVEPVCNEESYQQMLFAPATGELKVWRWIP
jgi:predicted choloylglycine hydrolase